MSQTGRLVRRAQGGDREAASELLGLTYQDTYRYLRRICGSVSEAEDLTQEVYVRLWQSLGRYESRCAFTTWVHAIAYNVYVDWRRKKRPVSGVDEAWGQAMASDAAGPEVICHKKGRAELVYQAVEGLGEPDRQIIHLHYYQKLSLREAAFVLDMPLSTLKYRLRGSLDKLRVHLKGLDDA